MQHNTEIQNLFSRAHRASGFAESLVESGGFAHPERVRAAYDKVRDALEAFRVYIPASTEETTLSELETVYKQLNAASRGAATILDEVLEAESDD